MKKISYIIFAVSVLMLASCDERNRMNPEFPKQDYEITFSTPGVNIYTKANPESPIVSFPTSLRFGVFGKKYTGDYTTWGEGTNHMYYIDNRYIDGQIDNEHPIYRGVQVSYSTSELRWVSQAFLWPKNGEKLAFIAYAPFEVPVLSDVDGVPTVAPSKAEFVETGIVINDYSLKGIGLSCQENLLYTDPVTNRTIIIEEGQVRPVNLFFNHALSSAICNLSLNSESTQKYVIVHKVDFTLLSHTGDFHQNLPTEQGGEINGSPYWDDLRGDEDSRSFIGEDTNVMSSVTPVSSDYVTFIPQPITGCKLGIEYTVINGETVEEDHQEIDIDLEDIMEGDNFEMGKQYSFNIVFDVDQQEIELIPTVTEWEPVEKTVVISQ